MKDEAHSRLEVALAWSLPCLTDLIATLRQAVLKLLGPRPAAARRRAIAEALEQLAAEQRQLAEADSHVGHHLRRTERDAQRAASPA